MGEEWRREMVAMARVFGGLALAVAVIVGLVEIGDKYGALAFAAAVAIVGVALFCAASFLDRPAAPPKGGAK